MLLAAGVAGEGPHRDHGANHGRYPSGWSLSGVGSKGEGNTWGRATTHKDTTWTLGTVASCFLVFLLKGNSLRATRLGMSSFARGSSWCAREHSGEDLLITPMLKFFADLFLELLPVLTSICLDFQSSPACWHPRIYVSF